MPATQVEAIFSCYSMDWKISSSACNKQTVLYENSCTSYTAASTGLLWNAMLVVASVNR